MRAGYTDLPHDLVWRISLDALGTGLQLATRPSVETKINRIIGDPLHQKFELLLAAKAETVAGRQSGSIGF
jgi:hypothetical protein